jgi:hypothetical protein
VLVPADGGHHGPFGKKIELAERAMVSRSGPDAVLWYWPDDYYAAGPALPGAGDVLE